jgi:branched-chain amino acid transport system permease protein
MLTNIIGVLFDGLSYGSLLFLIGVGLSITMGLMNFINLAHGAFAMIGGYVAVMALNRGAPPLPALLAAALAAGLLGAAAERLLFRRLYQRPPLDQTLFTIGFVFAAMAGATYFFGAGQQSVALPAILRGQFHILGLDLGVYRLFLILVVALIAFALQMMISRTRFGAQIRAAVDNQDASNGLGINVSAVFSLCFALGSALAGMGGALGVEVLGLDPSFPLKYMVYFLLVVVVGGAGTIKGPLYASLLLGICDVAGKYWIPSVGAFIIYAAMIVLLMLFPNGLGARRA